LHYLEESDVKELMAELESNFPNSEFVFEIYSPMITGSWHRHPHIRNAFSMFKWGLNTGKTLEKWSEGIKFLTEWHYLDRHPKRWRWIRFGKIIPGFRRIMKAVHLQFTPSLTKL
jgi:O-methyltransferase involved in polyketide biosynthesis